MQSKFSFLFDDKQFFESFSSFCNEKDPENKVIDSSITKKFEN